MALFAVTFRIKQDGSYTERYNSVVEAIKMAAVFTDKYWDETTSFFLIQSPDGASKLTALIASRSKFDENKDLVVVINLSQNDYAVSGHYEDDDINALMARR